jgi:hypothetical protein
MIFKATKSQSNFVALKISMKLLKGALYETIGIQGRSFKTY